MEISYVLINFIVFYNVEYMRTSMKDYVLYFVMRGRE